jgi:hypothetical protein
VGFQKIMALIVQKYGGTSVGSVERIEAVADRIAGNHATGDQLIVVVSAMSGETNRLLGLASDLTPNPSPRELDVLVSTGEQVSMALLSMALHARGIPALSLKGSQVAIRTDSFHNKARIQSIDDRRLRSELAAGKLSSSLGFKVSTKMVKRQRWGVAALIPLRLHSRLPLRRMNVRFTQTLMAFTRQTREWLTVPEGLRVLPSRKCSKWPAWAQKCFSFDRSSLRESIRYR